MKTPKYSDPKFLAYSITAGTVLAAAGPAHAQILYSGPLSVTIVGVAADGVKFDLNGGGPDFVFSHTPVPNTQFVDGTAGPGGVKGQFVPTRLDLNAPINAGVTVFQDSSAVLASVGGAGPFKGQHGYLPIRLKLSGGGDNFNYGWFEYTATADASSATISGWAFEQTPNATILAGAVPEPAQTGTALALLALGAAGINRMRKQRASREASAV